MAVRPGMWYSISGTKQVGNKLKQYADKFPARAGEALYDQMRERVEPDVIESTPLKTGDLRSTIYTEPPQRLGKLVSCTIHAGGPVAPYAWIVHEDLDAFHFVGEAKYIERPMNRASKTFAAELAYRLQVDKVL